MYIDPKAQELLENGKKNPTYILPIDDARAAMKAFQTTNRVLEEMKEVRDFSVPSLHEPVTVRRYIPEEVDRNRAFIFIHGGGWCLNSIDTADEICRYLAKRMRRVVFSIEYRLAPEHKYPAGLEDCADAVQWIFDNSAKLGVDPAHIAIGGDSSGAQFSAVLCLYFRDRGGVQIEKQILIYPSTDYWLPGLPSLTENDPYSIVDRNFVIWAWNNYLGPDFNRNDPYLFPLRAENLSNLPPAIVITADCDPLRDEGIRYAEKMEADGSTARLINYRGMMHGFFLKYRLFEQAEQAIAEVVDFLKD